MRRLRFIGWLAALGVGGLVFFRALVPADEVRIRRVVREAAQACSWSASDGAVARLSGAGRLLALCTDTVEVALDAPGMGSRMLVGREELRQFAHGVRTTVAAMQIEVSDLVVTVEPAREMATAQLVATVRADHPGEPLVREFRLRLTRLGRQWRIARVEPVRGFGM